MMTFQLLCKIVEDLSKRLGGVETEQISRRMFEKRISDLEAWAKKKEDAEVAAIHREEELANFPDEES